MELTDWIIIDDYCATRVLKGTDSSKVKNRVAFIEKTPRVRKRPFTEIDDYKNWKSGHKGAGGSGDHEALGQYGFDQDSREWCDKELLKLGYIITQ